MRTKRWLTRAITVGLAALIVIAAENLAGRGWYGELVRWLQPAPRSTPPPRPVARSGPVGLPVSVTPMRPEGNDSSVSEVPLPLVLVRTQRGRNSREGFAQIGVRAHSPQTYTAGALLANGARLTEIYDHYVVLEREGHTARLYLQGEAQPDARSAQGLLIVGGNPEPVMHMASTQDALTTYLRPSPVFVGDQLHGFALYPGRNPARFFELGLQPGDVLTRIKGSPVSDTSESLATLQTLMDGNALTAEVERQGIPQTLSIDGSILRREAQLAPEATPVPKTASHDAISSVALQSLLTQGSHP
jgi:hypothetical protein